MNMSLSESSSKLYNCSDLRLSQYTIGINNETNSIQ